MAARAAVEVVQPIPHFPLLKSMPQWATQGDRRIGGLSVSHRPMFYVPKLFKWADGYWLYRAIVGALRKARAARRIDLLDAHFGYPDGVGAFLAAKELGLPLFLTFRGLETDYAHVPLIRAQIRNALRYAAGCICVSHELRDLAIEYGADSRKLRVIHNAVDRSTFKPGNRADARAALGLSPDRPLIVSVGHLLAVKGHGTLIDAFDRLRHDMPGARLAIIGGSAHEPAYPEQLASQARRLGCGDAVTFVGKVPPLDVVRWLHAADLFALATRREGCCNAILEALASGTPVVSTPVGDNPRFVKDGENGLLAPVDDAAAIAEALRRGLGRSDWDAAAISRSLPVGDWSQVATQVLDFFDERLHDVALSRGPEAASATRRERQ